MAYQEWLKNWIRENPNHVLLYGKGKRLYNGQIIDWRKAKKLIRKAAKKAKSNEH